MKNIYLTGTGDHFQYYMEPIIIVLNVVKVGSCSILIVFILHFIILSIPSDIPMGYGNKNKSKYCDLDCYICPKNENYSFQLLNAVYFFHLARYQAVGWVIQSGQFTSKTGQVQKCNHVLMLKYVFWNGVLVI